MPKHSESMGEYLQRIRRAQSAGETFKRRRVERERQESVSLVYDRGYDPKARIYRSEDHAAHVDVPAEALAERERAASIVPTIHQALLGDPLPGRSALDKRRPRVVVDNG